MLKNVVSFYYQNLINLGFHLGGKKKIISDSSLICAKRKDFLCLNIRYTYTELKRALFLIDYIYFKNVNY